MSIKKDSFIADILKELEEENVALFAGAGLSVPAGYVSWIDLLKPIADELDLDIEQEKHDLVSLAQYHVNVNGNNRSQLNKRLLEEFSQTVEITENHKILSRLPINTYWTTNYDNLIEKSLAEQNKKPDVKFTKQHMSLTVPKRDVIVYKMHGDIAHPNDAVLTKDDYERYHIKMDLYLSALKGDLLTKTFIFIGFSFTDPNLDYILSRVRLACVEQRRHYCFLKKVSKNEDDKQADFEYKKRKQDLFIGDLKRFNICTVLVDEYNEITQILGEIETKHKQKNIFISGAAKEYGTWGRDKSEQFISELSKQLIENGYKIISGFGLGIGSAVISGALNAIYSNPSKYSKDDLILRPFPQNEEGKVLWTPYRKDMIDYAGVAIFIFGNKVDKQGNIVLSNGMREEFEIAKNNKLLLIPIGATGYMANTLWEEVKSIYEGNEALRDVYLELGSQDKEPEEIMALILKFLQKIK